MKSTSLYQSLNAKKFLAAHFLLIGLRCEELFLFFILFTPLYNFLKNKITHKALSNV